MEDWVAKNVIASKKFQGLEVRVRLAVLHRIAESVRKAYRAYKKAKSRTGFRVKGLEPSHEEYKVVTAAVDAVQRFRYVCFCMLVRVSVVT